MFCMVDDRRLRITFKFQPIVSLPDFTMVSVPDELLKDFKDSVRNENIFVSSAPRA